jgi:hypothetical protein
MNTLMINNREYIDTLHSIETYINIELIDLVSTYYRIKMSELEKNQLRNLSIEAKLELINLYKEPEAVADDSFELNIL